MARATPKQLATGTFRIEVTPEEAKQLDELAAQQSRSPSEQASWIVREHLKFQRQQFS